MANLLPLLGVGKKAGDWWLSGDISAANCIAAYQPKGVASYAASKINLANPGTYNLEDAGDTSVPSWNGATGWNFDGSDDKLYASGYPHIDTDFSIIARGDLLINHNPSSIIFSLKAKKYPIKGGWAFKSEQWNNLGNIGYTVFGSLDDDSGISTPSGDSIFALTRDGTNVIYYIEGSPAPKTITTTFNVDLTGFYIGAYTTGLGTYFDFLKNNIYALSYYHIALTADQVSALTTAMVTL